MRGAEAELGGKRGGLSNWSSMPWQGEREWMGEGESREAEQGMAQGERVNLNRGQASLTVGRTAPQSNSDQKVVKSGHIEVDSEKWYGRSNGVREQCNTSQCNAVLLQR